MGCRIWCTLFSKSPVRNNTKHKLKYLQKCNISNGSLFFRKLLKSAEQCEDI